MAKLQLRTNKNGAKLARDVAVGEVFRTSDYQGDGWYLRVDPVSYLLNSNTIKENIAKGKPMVVNLLTGTCMFIKGDTSVVMAETAEVVVVS